MPATKNGEAGILPIFGGWHLIAGTAGVKHSRQPAVAMDGTAGGNTERAKGLEPSTSSLGSSVPVVLSPANKRVAARRGKRCTGRCTSTRQEGAVSAGDGKPPVSDAAARTAGKQHPAIQDLAARLASLPPEAIAALQALFGGPPERPKNSG